MTPDELDVLFVTIRSTELALSCLEVAAEAADEGVSVDRITGLLRSAAEQVLWEHPGLFVAPETLTGILATILAGMRAERQQRLLAVDG
jgi:hypothetical protein